MNNAFKLFYFQKKNNKKTGGTLTRELLGGNKRWTSNSWRTSISVLWVWFNRDYCNIDQTLNPICCRGILNFWLRKTFIVFYYMISINSLGFSDWDYNKHDFLKINRKRCRHFKTKHATRQFWFYAFSYRIFLGRSLFF